MDRFLGKRLDARYEIQEIVGVGGMAVVYKAFDIQENRVVAVKILKDEFGTNSEFLRRFQNESKVIAVLSHPNIVKVFDVSFGDNFQYIVMEYIDGITLKEYIERKQSVPWKDALYFTVQILRALQHAHDKGIVHRDVKPQNIMLLRDGTIKVTDFGIARFSRSEERTITDKAIGSVHYISPEQAKGEPTDEKADLYSVGVLMYEMLTGCLPFDGDNAVSVAIMQLQDEPRHPRDIDSSIPLGLEQITMRAMRKNPEHRYRSDAEMLRDLEEFKRNPVIDFGYEETCVDANDSTNLFSGSAYTEEQYYDNEPETTASEQSYYEQNQYYEDDNYYDNADIPQEKEVRRTPVIPILAGIAAAVIIVFAIIAIWFVKNENDGGKNKNDEFKCPNLVGMSFEEATNKYPNLKIIKVDSKPSDKDYNVIIDQNITEGKKLKNGATIEVILSSGNNQTTVPTGIYGIYYEKAQNKISESNLVPQIEEIFDDEVEVDCVIKTEPAEGDTVDAGSTVIIYVSKGPEIITKPLDIDVIGTKKDEAKTELEQRGLVVVIVEQNSYKSKDTVIDQSIKKGELYSTGVTITLTVSNGEKPTEYKYEIRIEEPDEAYTDTYYFKIICGNTSYKAEKLVYELTLLSEINPDEDIKVYIIYGDDDKEEEYTKFSVYDVQ